MDIEGVRRVIRETYGTQKALAARVGISPQALSAMLRRDAPTRAVLDELGLERAPAEYRRIRK